MFMVKSFLFLIVIGLLIVVYIRYLEAKSVFFPYKGLDGDPSLMQLTYEDVFIKTADNVDLHGWFIPYPGSKFTMLYCHGNGGNITTRLDKLLIMHQLQINIFAIDYRGYGRSKGVPTESGVYLDVKSAYDYLIHKLNLYPDNIILYGESLGGAIIVDLASKVEVGALILEGTFSSGKDIGKIIYPFIPKIFIPNAYDSLKKIRDIRKPKLFIHSQIDKVIPFELGEKLYKASLEPKKFISIVGAHGTAFVESKYKITKEITQFIDNLE
ncbi:MAG: alpha/beta hydrolase [Candidatus Omnitrophica bacterium]|nr:alpha/beta hydrolase [Candidatus Omnitrophota bacterium]